MSQLDESQAARDLMKLFQDDQPVYLAMRKRAAWLLLGTLQLMLRHPELTEELHDNTTDIAWTIIGYIATTPALQQLAMAGFDPQQDNTAKATMLEKLRADFARLAPRPGMPGWPSQE